MKSEVKYYRRLLMRARKGEKRLTPNSNIYRVEKDKVEYYESVLGGIDEGKKSWWPSIIASKAFTAKNGWHEIPLEDVFLELL